MEGEGNEVKENGPTMLTEGRALVSQDYCDDGVRISGNAGYDRKMEICFIVMLSAEYQ